MGLGLLDGESVAGVVDPGRPDGFNGSDGKKAARSAKILSDFGDYELLEEIGRGGQGVVYRAHQKSLNRSVALKVIGRGPWTTETHLKRFRREAEAAAHLEHPGIVPIYEVGDHEGQCYFSMKFVEGGQLDEVVRREPMPVRRAVELIAKVARTVHYAHEHGILHRDIKPGNILLDQNGEPHLTDFGLARLVEAESTVTATLDVLGTPSYMAPEQASGGTTKVSKATDVYGLGAVLYQLLTGDPPFAGGTTYETIKLLLETEPRQPRQLNPKIDRDLSTICLKCLGKDPKRRYSSALALAEDLEHWLKHEPILARRTGVFTRGRKWTQRNPTSAVLAASLVALIAVVGWNVWKSERISRPITKSIAVLPFENLSGNKQDSYFADGVQDEILTRLVNIADLKVISRASTQRYPSRPGNLSRIAKQLGVVNILEGSVQRTADEARVSVRLVNAQSNSQLWAETYSRKLTDIFGVASEIAKRTAESLQAKLTGEERQALAVKPTNNPEAYDAYLRGLASDTRDHFGGGTNSTDFYERAVQLDPNFALAWAHLSRTHALLYFYRNDANEGDAAKRALDYAQKLEPDSAETLLALGYYQVFVLDDYGAAKFTLERARELLPSNSDVPMMLAQVARLEGHWEQSIAYFEQTLALDPRNIDHLNMMASTYIELRQFPAALKLLDRALDITPNDPGEMVLKALIYEAQGNLKEARRLLSEIRDQKLMPDKDLADKWSDLLRLERKYGEALEFLQKIGDQLDLALTQLVAGDRAGAKVTAEQAYNTLEPLYRDKPDDLGLTRHLSFAYAVMGKKDLALKLAERGVMLHSGAKDATWRGPQHEERLAVIQTLVGENNRAIATLTQLLQSPYNGEWYDGLPITPALLRLDPIWDPLRADPAFQKLCQEK